MPTVNNTLTCHWCKIIEENKKLRELLWLNHGCSIDVLYGDDGEMQCHTCVVDFKRMTPQQIIERWMVIHKRRG
jgi:hypothetical protein